jgi:ArsR family transcriptional regulator
MMRFSLAPSIVDQAGDQVPVPSASLGEEDAIELARLIAVIADPVRLRILSIVASSPGVSSQQLERPLGRSQPTISHHRRILAKAGLIVGERRGHWAAWRIVPHRLPGIADLLGWDSPAYLAMVRPDEEGCWSPEA